MGLLSGLMSLVTTAKNAVMSAVRTVIPALQYTPAPANFAAVPGVTAGQLVNNNSIIQCQWGSAPMPLGAIATVNATMQPAANVSAIATGVNVKPFAPFCMSMTNPANAAFPTTGVYAPCTPMVTAQWTPGCTHTMISGLPALNSSCICICTIGAGTIKVTTSLAPTINVG